MKMHDWPFKRLCVLVILLGFVFGGCQRPPSETPEPKPPQQVVTRKLHGKAISSPIIEVPVENQQKAGIVSQPVYTAAASRSIGAQGIVVALPDVSDLKSRLVTAQADYSRAQATMANTRASLQRLQATSQAASQEYQRLKILNAENKNISDRALEAAQATALSAQADVSAMQATMQLDQANASAAKTTIESVREAAIQRLGPVVANWFISGSPEFQRLLARQDLLVQITLPSDTPIRTMPQSITVITPNGTTVMARYVSPALQTDVRVQGISSTYLASGQNAGLIPGVTVITSIPLPAGDVGVLVPNSAIVWWSGKPWVYVEKDPTHFYRQQLLTYTTRQDQWFVGSGLGSSQRVVTQGAQLLLSQEFQAQFAGSE